MDFYTSLVPTELNQSAAELLSEHSIRTSNIAEKYFFQMCLDHVFQIKCKQISHAVRYSNFYKGWKLSTLDTRMVISSTSWKSLLWDSTQSFMH
jgi:hypothetical protein